MRPSHKNKCLYLETPVSPRISTVLRTLLILEVQRAICCLYSPRC